MTEKVVFRVLRCSYKELKYLIYPVNEEGVNYNQGGCDLVELCFRSK